MATSTLFSLKRRVTTSKLAGKLYDQELLKEFRGSFSKVVKRAYEDIVSDWSADSKPQFVTFARKTSAGRYSWHVRVHPPGSIKAKRWLMVDKEGREGGAWIRPKVTNRTGLKTTRQISRLAFSEYIPKTLPRTAPKGDHFSPSAPTGGPPRVSLGGSGQKGQRYYATDVRQGAVEPRRFTELVIEPQAREEFKNAGRRAYQRVHRRLRGGG